VQAVLDVDPGIDTEDVVRTANERLEEQQKIRAVSQWPTGEELPRTAGTGKLKRAEIRRRVSEGLQPTSNGAARGGVIELLQRYAPDRAITPETTLDQLGLSSLDRVQLLMEIEQKLEAPIIDEASFSAAKTVADLTKPGMRPAEQIDGETFEYPSWNRRWWAAWARRGLQFLLLRPLTRYYARITLAGLENLRDLQPPVIFAPNHQSMMDVPAILCALPQRWRNRLAPAMAKEWFEGYFHRERFSPLRRFGSALQYYLSTLFFNAFPLPQREGGARKALRYMSELLGEGWCVLIFPEGDRTRAGELHPFQPGVAMLAAQSRVPVVPVRIEGLERVLHRDAHWPTRGRVRVTFGVAMRLEGGDYVESTKRLHDGVVALGSEARSASAERLP
jgi:long-chain acyl-CoA synthetase